jgi:glutaredoxin
MTEIYTLPTCPICEMVKKKLAAKEIPYIERSFEDLPKELETDRAPVLAIDDGLHPGYPIYLLTPTSINNWINEV